MSENERSSSSSDLPDTLTKAGPGIAALLHANRQLQVHAASPSAFERRFEGSPPSYHSRSRSRSLTPNVEPSEAADDDPGLLEKLGEDARAIPLLWEQNKYLGGSTKQIQRDIDAWEDIRKLVEQEKAEEKESLFKLLTSRPSYGLFKAHEATPKDTSSNRSQADKAMIRKRKRSRTEVEPLSARAEASLPSSRPSQRRRADGAREGTIRSRNSAGRRREKVEAQKPPRTLRRSKHIAAMM